MIDEKQLLIEIKAGSERSYNQIYRLWVSRLYHFVYRLIKSENATDDIVQETFFRIWTHRETLNPDASFKAYLFTIAYNLILKEFHRQLHNPQMENYIEYQDLLSTTGEEMEWHIDFDNFVMALQRAKKKLSPRQKEIFELNKELNIPVIQIAQQLSINEQVVRNQLSAALKIVRNELRSFSYTLFLFL